MFKNSEYLTWLHDRSAAENKEFSRRDMLKMGMAGLMAASVPLLSTAKVNAATSKDRWSISLRHGHTGESYSGVYRVGDRYLPEAFERINHLLRDFRTGEIFPMDPHVIDIVSMAQRKVNTGRPTEVLSGYRSPRTNAMLRRASGGVAKNSYHMYGQALDIRMPGSSIRRVREAARSLRAGGVGYYPKSGFVHVDTGDVRSW